MCVKLQGDVFGNWDTNTVFLRNSSIFVLEFDGSKVTVNDYSTTMHRFKNELKILGEKASRRDASWNAMMWATFTFSDDANKMYFYSSADARFLYQGNIHSGFVSSASAGICRNPKQYGKVTQGELIWTVPTTPVSSATLNGNRTGIQEITPGYYDGYYPADASSPANSYGNNSGSPGYVNGVAGFDIVEPCPEQYPFTQWDSWSESIYTSHLEVGFDLRTIACALAVNMGITKLSTYVKVLNAYIL